ncbi:Uncharacterized protein SCF082_LOCUS20887 [Durusdinium trenchii]|uniref:Major facilitator superfamily (MFS) profile domain-containing protein n=1 Tax=Durusdinium trenchii TaxID=1381693 RepID=A0ABP0L8J2_9DINO
MVDWTQIGFAACLMVNLVDVMGTLFTAPVLVPYGQSLGASTAELASFSTVRFGLGIVSFLWMPRLADVKGTKVCVLVSVLGSSIAYAMQGNSHYLSGCARANYALQGGETLQLWEGHECQLLNGTIELYEQNATALGAGGTLDCISSCQNKNGVYFFLAGRALAGFFGGTQPILRSYVSEISLPNLSVLKLRMTLLFASQQAGSFALSPIAGVISQFGLFWPWYVSAGTGVLVFMFASVFFQNAKDIRDREHRPTAVDGEPAVKKEPTAPDYEGPPPMKDKILWLLLLAYVNIFITVSALLLLLPLLLEYESFGLVDPHDVALSRERLAAATSMVMVPNGVSNLVFSTVGYLLVSSKIGDVATMRIGAAIASVVICLYGFASTEGLSKEKDDGLVWPLPYQHEGNCTTQMSLWCCVQMTEKVRGPMSRTS